MNVSVIVPCYNVEKYIEKCILSIVANTGIEFEVIAVDDGSTDETLNILNRLADKYKNLKVIPVPNQGVSHARNIGIANATGDYLLFVDSDDWIASDIISYLSDLAYKNKLDVLIFNYADYYHKDKVVDRIYCRDTRMVPQAEALQFLLQEKYLPSVCNKMIRRKILVENNIEFNVDIKMGEDLLISTAVLCVASNIMHTEKIGYYYRMRENSVTHSVSENVLTIRDAMNRMQDILSKNNMLEKFRDEIEYLKFKHLFLYRVILGPVVQPYHYIFYSEYDIRSFFNNKYYSEFKNDASFSVKFRLLLYKYFPYSIAKGCHCYMRKFLS